MSKKSIKMHQKGQSGGMYQAARLPSGVKNFGTKNLRKPSKSK